MDENEDKLTNNIDDLIKELEGSGTSKERKLAEQAKKMQLNRKNFNKSLADLQESLDYLRVCIKYQAFDLEATRRENEYLRKLLESKFDDEEPSG